MVDKRRALGQLKALEKKASMLRLAADGWDKDWKTLIATLMSARTTDKLTIPVAEKLFNKFNTLKKLDSASYDEIASIIRPVNFYKTKVSRIKALTRVLLENYGGRVPHDLDKLVTLPGVGRKTANVFLAEKGRDTIGVDTHVSYISKYLGWTTHPPSKQHLIEHDLESLFPRKLWGRLNWILVRFGQTNNNRRLKNKILDEIKMIK